jgi:nicotinamide-nucleotide amidase
MADTSSVTRTRKLAEHAGRLLLERRRQVVTAESCTGGGVAAALTDVPGSSQWFERGYVTYSNLAKEQDLGVSAALLADQGAVSATAVVAMAEGALRSSGANLAVAVSGIAGPDGGTPAKPVGLVWFAIARRGGAGHSEAHHFPGDRAAVRLAAVHRALELIIAEASEPAGADGA